MSETTSTPERRVWVYVQRPKDYEIAGCPCGNTDPDWSEFAHMLWCPVCRKDFVPEHAGIFDGPIPVNTAHLMGIDLRQVNLQTGEIRDPCEKGAPQCPETRT